MSADEAPHKHASVRCRCGGGGLVRTPPNVSDCSCHQSSYRVEDDNKRPKVKSRGRTQQFRRLEFGSLADMCKHILNAQVAIRAPCCQKWYECSECHSEQEDHRLLQITTLTFACKKCKKVFRKDAEKWEESDEYCPNCDNHFVIEAKTPKAALSVESEDVRMDNKMLKDDRQRLTWQRSIFDPDTDADKLG